MKLLKGMALLLVLSGVARVAGRQMPSLQLKAAELIARQIHDQRKTVLTHAGANIELSQISSSLARVYCASVLSIVSTRNLCSITSTDADTDD